MKTLDSLLCQINSGEYAKDAFRRAAACTLAVSLAIFLRLENPYWAAISAFLVMQADTGSSLKKCFERVCATICGSLLALLMVMLLGNHAVILLVNIFIIVSIAMSYSLRNTSYIAMLSAITFLIIIFNIYTNPNDLISTVFFRCSEVSVGIISETIIALYIFPVNALDKIKNIELKAINSSLDYIAAVFTKSPKVENLNAVYHLAINDISSMKIGKLGIKYETLLLSRRSNSIKRSETI